MRIGRNKTEPQSAGHKNERRQVELVEWLYYSLSALGGIVVILIAVVLIRTLRFKPRKENEVGAQEISFDRERVIENLRLAVKCRTVSDYSRENEDEEEFAKLLSLLPERYPAVYRECTLIKFPDRGLLYRWRGKDSSSPTVLMAHYDVVPTLDEQWKKPPFEGIVEDGVLWGRGTLDTKVTFCSTLFAVDSLIERGFVPKQDVYLAFSGCEEVNGKGAVNIVEWFKENKIEPAMVLDEGGAVVENVFPGVARPCAFIGIAEKGLLDLEYEVTSSGGHSSAPKPHTPVGILSRACVNIEAKPFKMHLTPPVRQMFDTLGRHSSFLYRMIFANLWLFKGILNSICKKSGGELNALVRTTVAFTQMKGSTTSNVIPPRATMVSNLRLNPCDTMDSATEYIKSCIGDGQVKINTLRGMDPSRISRTDTEGYESLVRSIKETWGGTLVSPYLMVQCSDSRHWGCISDKVYRFSAMDLTAEERSTIHGHNERIRLDCLMRAQEFYLRLIERL